jgi:multiple sugar transport system permease protein
MATGQTTAGAWVASQHVRTTWFQRFTGGRLAAYEARWGYMFITPWVLGFLIFTAGPMIASMYFSFCNYNVLRPPQWIGFENYRYMLSGDDRLFWQSVKVTVQYVVMRVPMAVGGALIGAIILNQEIKGRVIYRALFFIPSITPGVAALMVWQWVLNTNYGLVNTTLESWFGIQGPSWFGDPRWAMRSLVMIGLWGTIGGPDAIIFLSALQDIPSVYYEAAKVDGANWLQLQRNITLPLITPALFFVLVLSVIGTFQVFTAAYIATGGGPAYATYFYVLHLYNKAFQNFEMGYSSALAWVLAFVLLIVTYLQQRGSERWVFYGGA